MRIRPLVAALACLSLPVLAGAGDAAELDLPSFTHLQSKASESVDLNLGPLPLTIAGSFMKGNSANAEIMKMLKELKTVQVRSYKFDADYVYSKADIDAVRKQFSRSGWSPLVQTHNKDSREDVDIFYAVDGDKIKGMAVVTSTPREFTIVNIVGSIDLDQLSKLGKQFGVPGVPAEKTAQ